MNIGTSLAALALTVSGTITFGDVEASGLGIDNMPDFLQRAEIALARGNAERAVGLIVPRIARLRGEAQKHRANATLCNAHLRQKDYRSADEACHLAAASDRATWSDYNNLGALAYLTGDTTSALAWFEKAAALAPGSEAVAMNLSTAVEAGAR